MYGIICVAYKGDTPVEQCLMAVINDDKVTDQLMLIFCKVKTTDCDKLITDDLTVVLVLAVEEEIQVQIPLHFHNFADFDKVCMFCFQ